VGPHPPHPGPDRLSSGLWGRTCPPSPSDRPGHPARGKRRGPRPPASHTTRPTTYRSNQTDPQPRPNSSTTCPSKRHGNPLTRRRSAHWQRSPGSGPVRRYRSPLAFLTYMEMSRHLSGAVIASSRHEKRPACWTGTYMGSQAETPTPIEESMA